ncbi:Hypothetical protein CINCED_3A000179 [Cinara cedri]|uniref:Uncharacterized protein n=1 Tax=Cinara cedri TaxID=506608 RepID=A0A5E4ML64_9HEMI|nr:Hypothetical protein CINCED_3A000179 [Cinara cedri]
MRTGETVESDKGSLSETNMRLDNNGRRFQFKKKSDEDNQTKPAFINDIINGKDITTQFYLDNKTVSNDGAKDLPCAKSLHKELHYLDDEKYINEANEFNNSSFKATKLSDLSFVSYVMRDRNYPIYICMELVDNTLLSNVKWIPIRMSIGNTNEHSQLFDTIRTLPNCTVNYSKRKSN